MKNLFCLLILLSVNSFAQSSLPNIVFILADDLGYGDLQCLNSNGKIPTPSIDKIAVSGLRFTDAHSTSSVCTPTRYSILTGRYAWRTSLKRNVLVPYDPPLIETGRTTLASMLRHSGYSTSIFGKWHLGFNWVTKDGEKPVDSKVNNNIVYSAELTGGPLDHGFDYFFGVDAPNYPPYTFIENRKVMGYPSNFYATHPYGDCRPGTGVTDWRLDHVLPDLKYRVVDYIDKSTASNKPFFIYMPLTAPHTPIAPTDEFRGISKINEYADFVMAVDDVVGAVLEVLKKNNLLENTLIVFTSDNGCSPEAKFKILKEKGHDPNAGMRGHKADLFEGGHRIPLLVQWPAKFPAGQIVGQTVSLGDFMATCASLVGYRLKNDEAEDSYNILPAMINPSSKKNIREATVHHSLHGDFAIRKGKWKLLLTPGSGGWSFPSKSIDLEGLPSIQLYNLEKDPAEKNNIEAKHPSVVRDLKALLNQYMIDGRSVNHH